MFAQTYGVELEAFPGRAFRGRVARIGRAADPHNKKFPVEVEVPNADTTLLPGMIARVTIEVAAPEPVALIPQDAAVDRYGLRYVYVLEPRDDGLWVARQRRVELRDVPFRPAELEVLGGLEPGERIATSGVRGLRDGVAVRLAAGAASS